MDHRFEFDGNYHPEKKVNDLLEHYRIEIDKLKRKL